MEELNIKTLLDYQLELSERLASVKLTDEKRKLLLAELSRVEEIINRFLQTMATFDKTDAEREKAEIERAVKELEIEKKIELEHRKLDVELEQARLVDAQKRSERRYGIVSDVLKIGGTVIGTFLGVGGSLIAVDKVLRAEDNDMLIISKAFQFIPKIFKI